MKQSFEKQEVAPEFEIKFGPWASEKEIQKAFFERRIIQFIGTRNFNLYLSDKGHSDLQRMAGIRWDDIVIRGHMSIRYGDLDITFDGRPPKFIESAAHKALSECIKQLNR